jgi:hypothetical protein
MADVFDFELHEARNDTFDEDSDDVRKSYYLSLVSEILKFLISMINTSTQLIKIRNNLLRSLKTIESAQTLFVISEQLLLKIS